jgi:DnaD/phage-associated family protein
MTTWRKHQQVRATKSKFPGPETEGTILISGDINCKQMSPYSYSYSYSESVAESVAGSYSEPITKEPAATADENLIALQKALQKGGILAPSGFEIERLLKWHDERIELDAISFAIEKAALANKRNVSYIEGILKGWNVNGITTRLQALEADQRFEQEKAGGKAPAEAAASIQSQAKRDQKRDNEIVSAAVANIRIQLGDNPPRKQAEEIARSYGDEKLVPAILEQVYSGGVP